jgi:hypothetical protein
MTGAVSVIVRNTFIVTVLVETLLVPPSGLVEKIGGNAEVSTQVALVLVNL